jgi:hypothetical protein
MGKGHDCVEDTLATRDLVLACVRDERVREWAEGEASCTGNFPSSKWENEQEESGMGKEESGMGIRMMSSRGFD